MEYPKPEECQIGVENPEKEMGAEAVSYIIKPVPGITRENRISDEGLKRLEIQLKGNRRPSQQVLEQWIKRYGEAAQELIDRYR